MAVLDTRARGVRSPSGDHRSVRSSPPEKGVAQVIAGLLGADLPIALRAYDGSRVGPDPAPATIVLHSPDALRRIVTAPGELGLSRAYVGGDLDLEGDMFAVLELRRQLEGLDVGWRQVLELLRLVGLNGLRPLPPPAEEVRPRGRLHSTAARRRGHLAPLRRRQRVLRDPARALDDLLVRGVERRPARAAGALDDRCSPSPSAARLRPVRQVRADLPQARAAAGRCGCSTSAAGGAAWCATPPATTGSGPSASPSPPSRPRGPASGSSAKAWPTRSRSACRTTATSRDGPFDAISSIGMFEHVGRSQLRAATPVGCTRCCVPEGRLLNHAISRPPGEGERIDPKGFMGRYVFPDGELIEVGSVVTELQQHRARGAPRGEPAGALRPHPAGLAGQPRGQLGPGRRAGRRSPGPHLAPLPGRFGRLLRRRAASASTRCWRSSRTTDGRAWRCARRGNRRRSTARPSTPTGGSSSSADPSGNPSNR